MGRFASDVQVLLRDRLASRAPDFDWTTEYRVGRTPVDVGGESADHLVLVELEWRRADPADNTAKLFRHLSDGTLAVERVTVCQLFTEHYDLASGGVSSKRENAEFVGRTAAETLDGFAFHALTLPLDPPKRGGERPSDWRAIVELAGEELVARL
ncbi:hypothetical protein ACFPYI_08040 [Halomarina salina]|uniref:Restriction endonuclease n=1 Tax=Halomarina salina TaxID=1872699 RepID=A0ABD5RM46_9EURY|nr:hypothetical protein [Halomarina salina]